MSPVLGSPGAVKCRAGCPVVLRPRFGRATTWLFARGGCGKAKVSPDAENERIDLERRQPWDDESAPSARFSVDLFPQQMRKTGPLVLPTLAVA